MIAATTQFLDMHGGLAKLDTRNTTLPLRYRQRLPVYPQPQLIH